MLFCRLRLPSGSTFAQSELQLSTSTIPPPPLDYQLLPPHPAPTPRTSSCTFSIQYQPWVAPQARTPAQHIHYSPTTTRLSTIAAPSGPHAADFKLYFLDSVSTMGGPTGQNSSSAHHLPPHAPASTCQPPPLNPDNDHSNRRHPGNLRNWPACHDRYRPQTRPSR